MIIKYGFSNFLSFNKAVDFSMLAPTTKVKNRFKDNYLSLENGYDVQKTAVIVGENAGGKSNFVSSINYFKNFFIYNSVVVSNKDSLNANNLHGGCVKEDTTKQVFDIEITEDKYGIFIYHLEVDHIGIINESLEYRKNKGNSPKSVLKVVRKNGNALYNISNVDKEYDSIKEQFEQTNNDVMGLFVTKFALLGYEPAVLFTNEIINNICPNTNQVNYDLSMRMKREKSDLEVLKDPRFFEIFRMIDYSIEKIELDVEEPFSRTKIYRRRKDGSTFARELSYDSNGVIEFFDWAIQIFKVVYQNKTVIADEMDRLLNPVLSDRIISFINGKDHKGQFIFTTHNVLHLDLKNYMKEQIYFVSKDIETLESEMYSLADFPDVRYETSKVYEMYLKGVLGGSTSE